jgi:surface antigen
VANRISVPNNWGNANTWSYYAPGSGWTVSKRPVKGSIAQTTGPGYGHVALVEDVSDDGLMIKYSDMNGLAGWGRVGLTNNWVPASKFNNYIYR